MEKEQFVRVVLAEGDEQQLADIDEGDFIEFVGTLDGQEVPVRFYRATAQQD